jgi:hypothetical protein
MEWCFLFMLSLVLTEKTSGRERLGKDSYFKKPRPRFIPLKAWAELAQVIPDLALPDFLAPSPSCVFRATPSLPLARSSDWAFRLIGWLVAFFLISYGLLSLGKGLSVEPPFGTINGICPPTTAPDYEIGVTDTGSISTNRRPTSRTMKTKANLAGRPLHCSRTYNSHLQWLILK